MRVKELIEILHNFEGDAHLVIDGKVVNGLEQVSGKVNKEPDYYGNKVFTTVSNKKPDTAVRFTYVSEDSNGELKDYYF